MKQAKTTWEQWQVLQSIVSEGGFAQAAAQLHRSQSSVSYMVARLQEQLGVELLSPQGRRMQLTPAGEVLLRDAQNVLAAALRLEDKARSLQQGWEAEVRLAVDSLFPTPALLPALGQFAAHCANTRLQMHEVVMSGADDALHGRQVELAVAGRVPQGFLGDWLLDAEFVACAAPHHPLHALGRPLEMDDLQQQVQVVLRDSGQRQPRDEGWLGAWQRWTVSQPETAIAAVEQGFAFGWLAWHRIADSVAAGRLKPLPLAHGALRKAGLYLVLADPPAAGPATLQLAACLRAEAERWRAQYQAYPGADGPK
ncbi:LysR family transcriptional regulator [Aquitalea sp. FJL05]|uniref:LysR family transcriptional regulator n=1 Tax=Aquitalea TaxID=407217 RepID=UPI000F5A7D10|nr:MULTISPECIES: LysR family transcriptional regulator [Aquitalea]RQO72905.1 LysR family transcriptional regulator [Aquitalea sp. FJL05]